MEKESKDKKATVDLDEYSGIMEEYFDSVVKADPLEADPLEAERHDADPLDADQHDAKTSH